MSTPAVAPTQDAVRESIVKYTQHYVSCAIYGSWCNGEPKYSCGLDEARASLATPAPAVDAKCTASPDHVDILETIQNAADDWRTKGYATALAEVRDMANVGRALMEALPKGYHYMNCPSEIVSDLQNERDEAPARRFLKLVNRIADWTDDEVKAASPEQVRHIARLVRDGADPTYPPFARLAEAEGAAS